jgi:hypothetical protein
MEAILTVLDGPRRPVQEQPVKAAASAHVLSRLVAARLREHSSLVITFEF